MDVFIEFGFSLPKAIRELYIYRKLKHLHAIIHGS